MSDDTFTQEERTERLTVEITYAFPSLRGSAPFAGGYPVLPDVERTIAMGVRDYPELLGEEDPVFPDNPSQLQVHLVATADGLSQLGTLLLGLARAQVADEAPSLSLDELTNIDGGAIRLIVHRVSGPPEFHARSDDYSKGFRDGRSPR